MGCRKKVYTLTVTDTNNLKIDLEALKGSGVSVTRNGNEYTFTSRQMMMDPVLFEFRKNIPVANDMLIWGRPGYQTMMTGASDPVSFFVKSKRKLTVPQNLSRPVRTALFPVSPSISPVRTFWEMKSMRKLRPEKTARLKRSSCREPIW